MTINRSRHRGFPPQRARRSGRHDLLPRARHRRPAPGLAGAGRPRWPMPTSRPGCASRPDGTITILTAGAEMGQGSMTVAAAHRRRGNGRRLVEGRDRMGAGRRRRSTATRIRSAPSKHDVDRRQPRRAAVLQRSAHRRRAGAQGAARERRRRSGASILPTLKTEPSVVINPANGQRLSYGEIAAFGTVPATLPAVDAKELKAREATSA